MNNTAQVSQSQNMDVYLYISDAIKAMGFDMSKLSTLQVAEIVLKFKKNVASAYGLDGIETK